VQSIEVFRFRNIARGDANQPVPGVVMTDVATGADSGGRFALSGLRGYLLRVYNYMAATVGLALTGLVVYYGAASDFYASVAVTPWFWLVLLAPIALALLFSFRITRMSLGAAQLSFWAYAVLVGLSLSGVFLAYTGESIARVFFVSAGTFAATSFYGYTTRADLSRFRSFLFVGQIGIVLAMLVNMFLNSSALQLTVSEC
jgi:FtsH-binding integral membrane protein